MLNRCSMSQSCFFKANCFFCKRKTNFTSKLTVCHPHGWILKFGCPTFNQHCLLLVLQMFICSNVSPLIFHERSLIHEQTVQRPVCIFIDIYWPPRVSLSKSEEGVRRVLENVIALRSWQVSANSVQLKILWAVLMSLCRVFSLVTEQHNVRQYVQILFLKL